MSNTLSKNVASVNGKTPPNDFIASLIAESVVAVDDTADVITQDTEAKPTFKPFSMADVLNMPPKEWLIENVIGVGDLVMLYGGSGSGKTHVAIDLMFAALAGGKFARRFDTVRPLTVAYAAGEGLSGLSSRFRSVADFYSASYPRQDWSGFTFFNAIPQLYAGENGGYQETMINFIAEWKARQEAGEARPLDILVIDTLHTATVGSDENSAKDSGIILAMAKRAVQELGCSVVLVHHTGKNGNSERGSSALRGAMDAMILIEKISDHGTKAKMSCTKLKDGEQWQTQTLDLVSHLESVRVWWDDPEDADISRDKRKTETAAEILSVLIGANSELTSKQISDAMGKSPQAVNNVLARMEKDELVVRSQNRRGTWCYTITENGVNFADKSYV